MRLKTSFHYVRPASNLHVYLIFFNTAKQNKYIDTFDTIKISRQKSVVTSRKIIFFLFCKLKDYKSVSTNEVEDFIISICCYTIQVTDWSISARSQHIAKWHFHVFM